MVTDPEKDEEYVLCLTELRKELFHKAAQKSGWIDWGFQRRGGAKKDLPFPLCNHPIIFIRGLAILKQHKKNTLFFQLKESIEDKLSEFEMQSQLQEFIANSTELIGLTVDIQGNEAQGYTLTELGEVYGAEKMIVKNEIVSIDSVQSNEEDTVSLLLRTWRSAIAEVEEVFTQLRQFEKSYLVRIVSKKVDTYFESKKSPVILSHTDSYLPVIFLEIAEQIIQHHHSPLLIFDSVFELLSAREQKLLKEYLHQSHIPFIWEGRETTFLKEQISTIPSELPSNQILYTLSPLSKAFADLLSKTKDARMRGYTKKDLLLQTQKYRCNECSESLENECPVCEGSRIDLLGALKIDEVTFHEIMRSKISQLSQLLNDPKIESFLEHLIVHGLGDYSLGTFAVELSLAELITVCESPGLALEEGEIP